MQPRFACRSASRVPELPPPLRRSGFGVWMPGGAEREVGPLLSHAIKRATSVLAFLERAAFAFINSWMAAPVACTPCPSAEPALSRLSGATLI
jgi:hypothetical protein